jgi:histidinol-phosphate aminotransferase
MSKFWSARIRDLKPYTPGEQPKGLPLIKLNTNENPYPPSPRAIQALDTCDKAALRLYPDPNASELKAVLARHHGLDSNNIFVGNGSDEVLALAFLSFFKWQEPILFADITYSFYPVYCNLWNIAYRTIPLNDDFQIDIRDYALKNGGIIIANPNAPTGGCLGLDQIQALLDRNRHTVVIVDEAYVDFGAESAVGLVKLFSNLLLVHTLSKSRSLAGLRIGYALGSAELIEGLERVKNSFNSYPLDRLALIGAIAAIQDRDYFEQTCKTIMATRKGLSAKLVALGFKVLPSSANFVFVTHPQMPAAELYRQLRQKGILVRYFDLPRIDNHLRITVGTPDEVQALSQALSGILIREVDGSI